MTDTDQQPTAERRRPSWRIPAACLLLAAAMVGVSYAAVPLYDWFCRVTGYGGTLNSFLAGDAPERVSERELVIRFDANVAEGTALEFAPEQVSLSLPIGETTLANYVSENPSDTPFYGMATFNVTPHRAASYVAKIECFCFSEHKLEAGERALMPVSFYIDPAIEEDAEMDDIHTITFSYTFFATAPWSDDTENAS